MKTRFAVLALASVSVAQFVAAAAAPSKVTPVTPAVALVSRQADRQEGESLPTIPRTPSLQIADLLRDGRLVPLSASATPVEIGLKGEATPTAARLGSARTERPASASYCAMRFRF